MHVVGQHIEQFRLPVTPTECEDACHRALQGVDWQKRPTESLEVDLGLRSGDLLGDLLVVLPLVLLERLPALRRPVRRLHTLTCRAPAGPPGSQAAIFASRGDRIMVRISYTDRGALGTEVTISGAGKRGPLTTRDVRTVVREPRRSIEIQSGSPTPYRPPT